MYMLNDLTVTVVLAPGRPEGGVIDKKENRNCYYIMIGVIIGVIWGSFGIMEN